MPAVVRREIGRFAELLGICGFAVTQPVLDVFGDAPEQFVFRGASTSEIVGFSLLVAVVPAVVLWLPGALARLTPTRAGEFAHLVAIAIGVFVSLLQIVHHLLGTAGIAKALLAAVGAAAGVWLYRQFEAARVWSQMMAFFSLVFVGLFLFSSPTGDLAFAKLPEVVQLITEPTRDTAGDESAAPTEGASRFPDIVMIVLDSLPTAVLLDHSGDIDPVRYPALAEFAADATWYRSFTTVNAKTSKAIPAILSGQLPTEAGGGVWTQQPDTLFRLLGGSYHLTVSEALTRLCPEDWCGASPIPPPPTTTAATAPGQVPTSTTTTAPPEPTVELDRGGLSRLIGDAVDVWRDQIALDRDDLPVFTGFEETVVDTPTQPVTTTTVPASTTSSSDALDPITPSPGEVVGLQTGDDDRASELPRVESFRATIAPSAQPTLYYLHLVLPHAPYIFTETGATYGAPPIDLLTAAEWDSTILAEQLSLQMRFTDQLVGDILDEVRKTGLYDDALVIVMADHAAGLDRTRIFRHYDGTNASELMVTPLLIKAPNQPSGLVSGAPIEAIDVLPTLADMLNIDVPWEMDGESALDRDPQYIDPGCEDIRHYVRFGVGLFDGDEGVDYFEFCASDVVPRGLEPVLGELRPDDDWATTGLARLTPFEELLGRRWDELETVSSSTSVTFDRATETLGGTSPPIGVLRGTIDGTIAAEWVAVAVDGRIAGISPIYDRRVFAEVAQLVGDFGFLVEATNQFTIIVPSPLLSEGGYDLRVAALETLDGDLVATELEIGPS